MYFAKEYEGWLSVNNEDVYSPKIIKIPAPEYYVLYNGTKEEPEFKELYLSEAFSKQSSGYEWTAHMININAGKNRKLMCKCPTLFGYSEFVGEIRTNQSNGLGIGDAVDKAIDDCIMNDILKDYLTKHKAEVKDMILTEYNEKLHEKNLKKESAIEATIESFQFLGKNQNETADFVSKKFGLSFEDTHKAITEYWK